MIKQAAVFNGILLGFCSIFSYASEQTPFANGIFNEGMKHFKNKNYLAARKAFLSAEANNYTGLALIYNLGVVNYKLGHYSSATKRFLSLRNEPEHQSLAYYNLALIAFKMKQEQQAQQWLQKCIESNPPQALGILATDLLDKYQRKTITGKLSKPELKSIFQQKKFKTLFKSFAGYNDNVTQYLTYSRKRIADSFYNLQLDSDYTFNRYLFFRTAAYFHIYNNTSSYDTVEIATTLSYNNSFNRWNYESNISYNKLTIGSHNFQQTSDIDIGLGRSLFHNTRYTSRYRLQVIDILDKRYQHLEGNMHQLKQSIEISLKPLQFIASYIYEHNDRKDFYLHNQLSGSFSPETHIGEVSLHYLGKRFRSEFYGKLGTSSYPDKNALYPNSDFPRHVSQQSLLVMYGTHLSYKLHRDLTLIARFYYERNYSNIRNYRFEKSIHQIGFGWQY